MEAGVVVVECSFSDLIRLAPQTSYRSAQQNAKTLMRSVLAFQQDYSVPWQFCDGRRLAEQFTFHWLRRWYEKDAAARKAEAKRLGQVAKKAKKANGSNAVRQGGGNGEAQTVLPAMADVSAMSIEAQLADL